MDGLLEAALELNRDQKFQRFQAEVVQAAYGALSHGYAAGDNEVQLVKGLTAALKDNNYNKLHIYTDMIHGSRSYVEFNYRDKPTTKELGDMAIITLVTAGPQRLFQRLCIIQNKKAKDNKWGIDREQLFLLKNFPPFSGNRGIFRGKKEVLFRNDSGCLGAFGLLSEPGEMLFVSAPILAELLSGKNSLDAADICMTVNYNISNHDIGTWVLPFLMHGYHPKELFYMLDKLYYRHGHCCWMTKGANSSFLGNVVFGRDLYDLIRAWTQMSVGEITYLGGGVNNVVADSFANQLVMHAGLGSKIELPRKDDNIEHKFEGSMGVFILHMDIKS